jgi:hypothetical protein
MQITASEHLNKDYKVITNYTFFSIDHLHVTIVLKSGSLRANSHIPYRSHAVPMPFPCRFKDGFTHTMPFPCRSPAIHTGHCI